MSVVEVLERVGGVASAATLVGHTSRSALDRAVASGDVLKLARGRYALPQVGAGLAAAARLGGVLCLTDAAICHGWEVKRPTRRPHVCVPKGRKVPAKPGAEIHRIDLAPHQVEGLFTDVETTLTQCLRMLPFDEALTVACSALRHGVPAEVLRRIADAAAGPGSRQVRRVARVASGLSANPFESVLLAIAEDVPGLSVRPQVWVGPFRPDLVDERLRIVIEADSFAWHGGRADLARDARRYNSMVVDGWIVLRFSWEDVMGDPAYVARVLSEAVALAELHTERPRKRRKAA